MVSYDDRKSMMLKLYGNVYVMFMALSVFRSVKTHVNVNCRTFLFKRSILWSRAFVMFHCASIACFQHSIKPCKAQEPYGMTRVRRTGTFSFVSSDRKCGSKKYDVRAKCTQKRNTITTSRCTGVAHGVWLTLHDNNTGLPVYLRSASDIWKM